MAPVRARAQEHKKPAAKWRQKVKVPEEEPNEADTTVASEVPWIPKEDGLQITLGVLRTNLQHIWLKKDGRPMTGEEVLDIMEEHKGKHLGAFQVRGTWALRMLTEHHNEMKAKLGRNEDPAYFVSNVPPDMEMENIQDILQQIKWRATVKDGLSSTFARPM
eukprot:s184_g5.t1